MFNRRAIALLVKPSASAPSTSSSRGVSKAWPSVSPIAAKPPSVASGKRTIRPAATARIAASIWLAPASRDSTPLKSRSAPPRVTAGRVSPGGKPPSASTTSAASSTPTTTCPASATTRLKALRRVTSAAWTATRSRSAGASWLAACGAPFCNCRLHAHDRAAPDQANIGLPSDAVGTEQLRDPAESMRRGPVNAQDDVARQDSRLRRRASLNDRHHHQARGLLRGLAQRVRHGDGLQGDAEPASRDAAVLGELRRDAPNGRGRNDNDLAARTEGRHAQTAAGGVENGSTLLAAGKADVEHDAPVDQAAAAGVPLGPSEIDEPEPRAGATTAVGADHKRNRAGMRLARDYRWRGKRRCQPQHSDIGRGIAAGDFRGQRRAARCDQLKLIFSGQRLLGGNDGIGLPHHACDVPPVWQVD